MYSGVLFLAGTIVFSATVEFGGTLAKLPPKGFFPVVALSPGVIYIAWFWSFFIWCSYEHRKMRSRQ
jgi:hypothetical protein